MSWFKFPEKAQKPRISFGESIESQHVFPKNNDAGKGDDDFARYSNQQEPEVPQISAEDISKKFKEMTIVSKRYDVFILRLYIFVFMSPCCDYKTYLITVM